MSFSTPIGVTNSYFNLVYTLTTQQMNDTINLRPNGFFYLRDAINTTDGTNLGNNTIDQNAYSSINVFVTNTNQLVFNNRFLPSTGSKSLEIHFNVGPPNYEGDWIIQYLTYKSTTLSPPYYAQNKFNNSQINLTETTCKFTTTYELSTQQLNDTINQYPSGFYYIRDLTDNITLGNNTIDQTAYGSLNVFITNVNKLVFNNLVAPSIGIKNLVIKFNVGPPSYNDFIVQGTDLLYNAELLKNNISCFKEDSKILTNKGYILIQNLRKGDLIKTAKNGFKPIDMIGKRDIFHIASEERIKDQLYKCSKNDYPELFEDLIITGHHSILIDDFTNEEQKEKVLEMNEKIHITNDKYRLPVCLDLRASVYKTSGTYTIYHVALENEDYYMNYGIYANGLLVETCSKRYLKEFSDLILI
jgi:hypothetical protein